VSRLFAYFLLTTFHENELFLWVSFIVSSTVLFSCSWPDLGMGHMGRGRPRASHFGCPHIHKNCIKLYTAFLYPKMLWRWHKQGRKISHFFQSVSVSFYSVHGRHFANILNKRVAECDIQFFSWTWTRKIVKLFSCFLLWRFCIWNWFFLLLAQCDRVAQCVLIDSGWTRSKVRLLAQRLWRTYTTRHLHCIIFCLMCVYFRMCCRWQRWQCFQCRRS